MLFFCFLNKTFALFIEQLLTNGCIGEKVLFQIGTDIIAKLYSIRAPPSDAFTHKMEVN